MKYAFYPGCAMHGTAKEYDISTKAVTKELGIDLIEIPDWICCGATPTHVTLHLLSIALPVKNLILAKNSGMEMVVCCPACYNRLKVANRVMRTDIDHREKVNQIVGTNYSGDVAVKHLLQVLVEDFGVDRLSQFIKKPLEGLNVACYYGCLLTKPPKVAEFDDPEDPVSMDNVVRALGANTISWPYKTECCGASFSLTKTDIVLRLSNDILYMAKKFGADCIVVNCPMCQSNLDLRQHDIEKKYKVKYQIPVIYFTQLMGLAMGISPNKLGLNKLIISPDKLLREKLTI